MNTKDKTQEPKEEKTMGKANEIDLLRKALSERTKKQVDDCTKELNRVINETLNKHQCILDVSMTIRQGSIIPNIGVLPRESR